MSKSVKGKASVRKHRLTPKQLKFCQAYIETGNAAEAYRQSYSVERMKPQSIRSKAGELMSNGAITVHILELQEDHRKRHEITVDSLTAQLEVDRQLAHSEGQAGAAVSATMGQAKLHGLLIDKRDLEMRGNITISEADTILREAGLLDD